MSGDPDPTINELKALRDDKLRLLLERDTLRKELAQARADLERAMQALTKIHNYRSDKPDWNMVMAIAGDIVEPTEWVCSETLAKIGSKDESTGS